MILEIIAIALSVVSLAFSVYTLYSTRRLSGDLSIYITHAQVAYLADFDWKKGNPCTPKDLNRYEIKFSLTANSRKNIPTNIHDIELCVEFSNSQTRNITNVLKAKTHNETVIENPLVINVPENGAYSANYSAMLYRQNYWKSLSKEQTPGIEALFLTYMDDRHNKRTMNIDFHLKEPLSERELINKLSFYPRL